MSWRLAWIKMSSRPTWVTQGKSVKKTEDRREGITKERREGEGDRNREKKGKGKREKLSSQRPERRQDRILELRPNALHTTLCIISHSVPYKPTYAW